MPRISITTMSLSLSAEILERINGQNQIFVNATGIDFADTGFFQKTHIEKVEITQDISEESESRQIFVENAENSTLNVLCNIPISRIDISNPTLTIASLKLEAVKVIIAILEKFGLESRSFKIRAFDVQSEIRRATNEIKLLDIEPESGRFLEIHFKLEDDSNWHSRYGFLIGDFCDLLESIFQKTGIGMIEGTESGVDCFSIFCVGEDPKLILQSIKPCFDKVFKHPEDHVLLVEENRIEKIFIKELI